MRWGQAMTKHMRILVEDLEMDRERWIVSRNGQLIKLTRREFALLEALMLASPRPVSKTWIIENVWRRRLSPSTNVVNVIINHLRNKAQPAGFAVSCPYREAVRIRTAKRRKDENLGTAVFTEGPNS
jgi:DNA-binding response OmpR family regulator